MTASAAVERPRSAYQALERRATLTTAALLLALAGAAWWATSGNADDMSGMVQGLAQVGAGMPYDMGIPVFLGMWLTMMVAMMFPTIAPVVLLHRMVVRRQGGSTLLSAAFVAGYLAAWTAAGTLPLAVLLASRHVTGGSPGWVQRTAGAVLVVAGAYQFSRWKEACARACRSPLGFLMTHDFGTGTSGALRAGISHGAYCLGCCWALMAVLLVVGLMNLVWMAAISVVFLVEKHWVRGLVLARVAGTVVLVLGLAVLAHPSVLASVSQTPTSAVEDPMPTMP